jgi:YD repeat-containing protein
MTQIALESLLPVSVVERARRIQSESGGRLDLISDAELASLYATRFGESVLPVSRYPASAVAADRFRPSAGRQSATTPHDGLAIKYAYDADGNDAAITYPDNFTYSYAYGELDRMTNVSETPAGSTNVTSLAHYTYDPLSRRTTLTYANGASTAYSYDAFSGLSQIAHTFADTGKLPTATFSYTRDNNDSGGGGGGGSGDGGGYAARPVPASCSLSGVGCPGGDPECTGSCWSSYGPGGAFGAAHTYTTLDFGHGNTVTTNGLGETTSVTGRP